MNDERATRFLDDALGRRYSRRDLIRRAATLGLALPAVGAVLAACGGNATATPGTTGGGAPAPTTAAATAAASPAGGAASPAAGASPAASPGAGPIFIPTGAALNPLGVKDNAPLDVVIFKGGYGDQYAIHAEDIYKMAHPGAQIKHAGIQRLQEQLQPRFVGGNPPDVIDNSGAGNLDTASLASAGQLADLADLMDAPAFDTPGKKFKDTLIPGSQQTGTFSGKQFALEYAYTVYGIWYSSTLFQQQGWQYPQTWDDMLKLCATIKQAGKMAPWTYQGKYPQYMQQVLDQLVYKNGGLDAIKTIDNLEPNAWKQPAVKAGVEALYQLADKDYIMQGTAGLTHTEAQAAWLQHKAVFIPCGTWLENEEKGLVPADFNMVVQPTPSLAGDKIPFTGINAYAGENFIVPSKGKNVAGGKEFLRILFSKEGARFFSQNTKALTAVLGSADGLDLGTAFASAQEAVKKAGDNTFVALYGTWYAKMMNDIKDQMGAMLTKQITPDQYMDKAQQIADATAKDSSIKKYHR
ncbi:MAG TPA: N-acetylglucosamine/diacetylchitobiose ABC transporter substrate-binding protein [Thermomicrobiales bacterium]|nr:N-acetylglucosamine/diacetylchitobiose ABC transporter substrate-binding protein [Thermomicrobiales bacterium]